MKITELNVLQSKVVNFPASYLPAWYEPDGKPFSSFKVFLIELVTDEGIAGYGPCMGKPDEFIKDYLIGFDPLKTEQFWHDCMNGRESPLGKAPYGGYDIALWDIVGKAAGLPVCKMLGARRDRMPVYAATSRLLSVREHVEQVHEIWETGFRAVKLRLHRQDYKEDLKVITAVRDACPQIKLFVDCNQNNRSIGYNWWSRDVAEYMSGQLKDLGVTIIEEPLGRFRLDSLRKITDNLNVLIAGGEHSANIYEFRTSMDSYDVVQPDMILGDIGITGIHKLGIVSEFMDKQIMPHICYLGAFALSFAACLQVVSGFSNCSWVELPYDPPFFTLESQQFYIREPLELESDGCVLVPQRPGLGIEIDKNCFI